MIINSILLKKQIQPDINTCYNLTCDGILKGCLLKENRKKLLLLCLLSNIVYYKQEEFALKTKKIFTEYAYTVSNHTFTDENSGLYKIEDLVYGVFYIDNNIIVSFKGSSSVNDFLVDIDFIPMQFACDYDEDGDSKTDYTIKIPGKVHKGAYNLLFKNDKYKQILDKIKEYKPTSKIYIVGHSLGGMLATLFCSFLLEYYKQKGVTRPSRLVTFGCPKIGDSEFAKGIDSIRVVNDNDIIPKVPLKLFFGYNHPNKYVKIGQQSSSIFKSNITDHHIDNYVKSIIEQD
jgi:predicted lipase